MVLSEIYLGKVYTESIHVHAIEKACEALVESAQTLVHQLKMHKVGF